MIKEQYATTYKACQGECNVPSDSGIPVKPSTSGDIFSKIEQARQMWEEHGEQLLSDPGIKSALEDLSGAIEDNWALMRRLKVVDLCGRCATEIEGGGCCGAGIEEWYDSFVLLMNLMMGKEIPQTRLDKTGCLFLGPSGCLLKARFHFCINYLCHRIKDNLTQSELRELAAGNGREIYCGWVLENAIREKLETLQPR